MKKLLSVRNLVALGIGTAIFFVLGRFASIPTGIPNTNIDTSYALLALLSAVFGPVVGLLAGFIGHTLKDITSYGAWWSWIIASGVFGCLVGLLCTVMKLDLNNFNITQMIKFNIAQIAANAVSWLLVAPVLDILIYAEPVELVFVQGAVAGASNAVTVLVLGTALLFAYTKTLMREGSLKKEA